MLNWIRDRIFVSKAMKEALENREFVCPKCSASHRVIIYVRSEPTDLVCQNCKNLCWWSYKENRIWDATTNETLREEEHFICQ